MLAGSQKTFIATFYFVAKGSVGAHGHAEGGQGSRGGFVGALLGGWVWVLMPVQLCW